MRRWGFLAVGLLLLALALTACAGAMACTKTTGLGIRHAACSGTLDTLDGSRLLTFDLEDVALGLSIDTQINVSVTGGVVEVRYQNADGQAVAYQVAPGNPLALRDAVRVIFISEARITLEAVGGIASGVRYSAEFSR